MAEFLNLMKDDTASKSTPVVPMYSLVFFTSDLVKAMSTTILSGLVDKISGITSCKPYVLFSIVR